MRGGHAPWRACMRAGQSCRACARLGRRVGALHPNSDLAGPSSTPIASNRLRSLPSKQANLAIEGASLSFLGRIRARSSHNVSRFLGATVFTGVGYKVRHPALQAHNDCTHPTQSGCSPESVPRQLHTVSGTWEGGLQCRSNMYWCRVSYCPCAKSWTVPEEATFPEACLLGVSNRMAEWNRSIRFLQSNHRFSTDFVHDAPARTPALRCPQGAPAVSRGKCGVDLRSRVCYCASHKNWTSVHQLPMQNHCFIGSGGG